MSAAELSASVAHSAAADGKGAKLLPANARHIPGEGGLWVLLCNDILLFSILFIAYLYQRGEQTAVFNESQHHLNLTLGGINTLVLLTSSILVVFALRALRNERIRHLAPRLTVAGIAVGACFVGIKGIEYHQKIVAGLTPHTDDFYMWFYVITGLHLVHVIFGLVVLTILSRLARTPHPTPGRIAAFEGGACWWHMVDLLWIAIFPLIYLVH